MPFGLKRNVYSVIITLFFTFIEKGVPMNQDFFKELYSKIDYETYEQLRVLSLSGIAGGSLLANLVSEGSIPNQLPDLIILSSAYLFLKLTLSKGQNYTKDVLEIRHLYNYFIDNYLNLNKSLGLENPIQMQTLYDYLLFNGYLSRNHTFTFTDFKKIKNTDLGGVSILMGKGNSRNIANNFCDILNPLQIKTALLNCYIPNYYEYASGSKFDDVLAKQFDKTIGNNTICLIDDDQYDYYLDPANCKFYKLDRSNRKRVFNYADPSDVVFPKKKSLLPLNGIKTTLKMQDHVLGYYPSISSQDAHLYVDRTLKLCHQNGPIFNHFYDENRNLYEEINKKVLKITKAK